MRRSIKNYKSLQSFKYFTSGWVMNVKWRKYHKESLVLILGQVRHSYAASKAPLQSWVLVHANGVVKVAHCTCMAGLAETCSHVGALLYWVETAVRIRDQTPCTSKDNKWSLPAPVKDIPYLQLRDIDFTAPKCHSVVRTSASTTSTSSDSASHCSPKEIKVFTPSHTEQQEFFCQLSQEQNKRPVILSVVEPYNSDFVLSSDHLLLQYLYRPEYLERDYADLVKVGESQSHLHEEISQDMVDHLEKLTRTQAKSREWFKYRAGRITASRFKQVLCTDLHQPSLSLLKSICYPETCRFSNKATSWGCEHEKDGLKAYASKMSIVHEDLRVSSCGFYVCVKYPYLGASPDAIVECKCCGKGVVEVKCPLCAREDSLLNIAEEKRSFCLQECDSGKLQLKHNHSYYYQCQLQMYVTNRMFCDFVVWSETELHIERLAFDDALLLESIPTATNFFSNCILPELLGKWYTRPTSTSSLRDERRLEEDDGSWCHCKENKGGDMVGCENRLCQTQWFHLECVGLSAIPRGKWYCSTCQPKRKRKASSM